MSFSRRRIWLVLGVYVVLTAVITQPTLSHLGTHIPGSEGDALNHLWTFTWVKDALLSGQNPFYTTQLYYPHGVSLLFHNIAWVHIAVWLPLQAIIGGAAAYALVFIANFTFNAFAFYLFAREEVASETAAFIGGLVCGFWPYALSHHNHPNLILIGFIPLTMRHLRRLVRKEERGERGEGRGVNFQPPVSNLQSSRNIKPHRDVVWTAVSLTLIGLTRWQLLVMSILPLGCYLLYQLWQQHPTRQIIGQLATTGLLAMALMAPLAAPVLITQLQDTHDPLLKESPNQTDLLAYFVPNRYHPLWGETAFKLYDNFSINKNFTPTISYTVLLLLLIAALFRWRESWFWLLLAGLNILLALGSSLRFNGTFYGTLPYAWLQDTFLGEIIRHPDRLNVLLAIPVAMGVAWGITAVSSHRILPLLASLLIITESLMTFPQYPLNVSLWYQQIAQETDSFAILDLPMDSRSFDKEYMLYQIAHGKPIIGGHVSRLPAEALTFIKSVPFLQQAQGQRVPPMNLVNVSQQMAQLAQADIRYLVLHEKFLRQEQEDAWQEWLIVPPIYQDKAIIVYETAALQNSPPISQPLLTNEQNAIELGLVQTAVTPQTIPQAGNLHLSLSWGSHQPPTNDIDICFELHNDTDIIPLTPCQPLAVQWPSAQWQTNEWLHTEHDFPLSPHLADGDYEVVVHVVGGDTAVLDTITYNSQPRQFTAPSPQNRVSLQWPAGLNLIGYDTAIQNQDLSLSLHWQAQQRLDTSYKYFIHAVDAQTNEVITQIDTVPRNWNYPTSWWEANEYVTDRATLNLPPGTYHLLVGWYEPDTGTRLPVETTDHTPFPNQIAPLTTITIPTQ